MGYSPRGRKESDTTERLHFTSLRSLNLEAQCMKGWANNQTDLWLSRLCPVLCRHLKCLVVSPSSYTNFTFIFWKPFCFRVAFNFFFFPELYKTKPNHNQRLLNLLPPPHQMFMVYSKPGVSMESLRDSLFFYCQKNQIFNTLKKPSALWGFPWHESRYGSEICLSCFNLNSSICFFYFLIFIIF